jgi:hypothetical protein
MVPVFCVYAAVAEARQVLASELPEPPPGGAFTAEARADWVVAAVWLAVVCVGAAAVQAPRASMRISRVVRMIFFIFVSLFV